MQYTNLYSQFSILSHHFFRLTVLSVLLGITCMPQKAHAQFFIPVSPPPEPNNPDPRGGNTNQGIEGINEIIATTGNPNFIDISFDFTVDGLDGLPQPDNVIGGGNLLDVVKRAGNVWETAFPDFTENVSLRVGWADFGADLTDPILAEAVNSSGVEIDGLLSFYIHGGNSFPNIGPNDPGVVDVDFEGDFPSLDLSSNELASSTESKDKIDGLILFNSRPLQGDVDGDGEEERILLYLDEDPLNSDVFGSLEDVADDDRVINGINYGRSSFKKPEDFNSPENNLVVGENDIVIDAFSVALHELQHNLGLTRANPAITTALIENNTNSNGLLSDFQIEQSSFNTLIPNNTIIPTTFDPKDPNPSLHIFDDLDGKAKDGTSLTEIIFQEQIATPVGLEFATNSERKCLSEADVLAIAKINGFNNFELNPCQALSRRSVPEPSATISLIMVGFGCFWVSRKRL